MTFWKAKRTKEWRRAMYRGLRRAGLSRALAKRLQDWSEPHIKQFLRSNRHLLKVSPERAWEFFEEELIIAVMGG